jgi:replicative DNA helicase
MDKPKTRTTNTNFRRSVDDITKGLGKLQPQAIDIEAAILGAVMLEKDALIQVIDILRPESFYHPKHQLIYKAVVQLFDRSEPIDILTVANQLRMNGELEMAGGAFYITELTSTINSAANLEAHTRIIQEQAIKRELISIASQIEKDAFEETTDVFELLDKTEQLLFKVSEGNVKKNFADMRSILRAALLELESKRGVEGTLTGVPSGFTQLDRLTSGWQKSDLIILAARPAMGKTAFVISAMRNAAVDFNKPVAIFSLEMSSVQLVNRLISAEAELESEKIKKGNLEEYEWQQLHHKIRKLDNAPIYIDDTPALTIRELRTKCRRLKQKHGLEMIIIDYLQLMSGDGGAKGGGNREQEISQISRSLKTLAKELSVPVIALSQLSRAVETRGGDKKPQLSDLRESGAIEQDADMVIFLYRPEYYKIEQDEMGNNLKGLGEIIIAKHRNGSLDSVFLKFIGKYTKFADMDSSEFSGFSNEALDQASPGFDSPATSIRSSRINDLNNPLPPLKDMDGGDFVPF